MRAGRSVVLKRSRPHRQRPLCRWPGTAVLGDEYADPGWWEGVLCRGVRAMRSGCDTVCGGW